MNENLWYGYQHENGTLHPRRFFGDHGDITEARESPFVTKVFGPFPANDRAEALWKLQGMVK